jgi:hypothetical protein
MAQFNIYPNPKIYRETSQIINILNDTIMIDALKKGNGTGPATVILALEELSQKFIPWASEAIREEDGIKNATYIQKRGNVREVYIHLTKSAILTEMKYMPEKDRIKTIDQAIDAVADLAKFIFS